MSNFVCLNLKSGLELDLSPASPLYEINYGNRPFSHNRYMIGFGSIVRAQFVTRPKIRFNRI